MDHTGKGVKRHRDYHHLHSNSAGVPGDHSQNDKIKMANRCKPPILDFRCKAFFNGSIFDFQLSDVFSTPQSKIDIYHIEQHYCKFISELAIPIVVTQDRAELHQRYATPTSSTPNGLDFMPSFILASDHVDRLIASAFKSVDLQTLNIQRSVIIVDRNFDVHYIYKVPGKKFFPMKTIFASLEQARAQPQDDT